MLGGSARAKMKCRLRSLGRKQEADTKSAKVKGLAAEEPQAPLIKVSGRNE